MVSASDQLKRLLQGTHSSTSKGHTHTSLSTTTRNYFFLLIRNNKAKKETKPESHWIRQGVEERGPPVGDISCGEYKRNKLLPTKGPSLPPTHHSDHLVTWLHMLISKQERQSPEKSNQYQNQDGLLSVETSLTHYKATQAQDGLYIVHCLDLKGRITGS